jgi:hypothetical protein
LAYFRRVTERFIPEEKTLQRIKNVNPRKRHDLNYKVEENEVGGTCGTNGGEEERV